MLSHDVAVKLHLYGDVMLSKVVINATEEPLVFDDTDVRLTGVVIHVRHLARTNILPHTGALIKEAHKLAGASAINTDGERILLANTAGLDNLLEGKQQERFFALSLVSALCAQGARFVIGRRSEEHLCLCVADKLSAILRLTQELSGGAE